MTRVLRIRNLDCQETGEKVQFSFLLFFFSPFEVGNRRECSYVGRNDPVYTDRYHKNKKIQKREITKKVRKMGLGLTLLGVLLASDLI